MSLFLSLYRRLFIRPSMVSFHRHLYKLALRGLGVLNAEGEDATGERWLQEKLGKDLNVKTIVDVGANTDVFGLHDFSSAIVWACEPHPKTFQQMTQKYQAEIARGQLVAVNVAISNKKGTLKLWDFADDAELKATQPTSTLSSLSRDVIEELHGQKAQSFSVHASTIDELMQQQKIKHIDILKIDTEGFEFEVLQGAAQTLEAKKISIIQFEFNEMNVHTHHFLHDFMKLLPNFSFYRLLPNGLLSLDAYRPLTHEIFGFQNIVCVEKKVKKSLRFLPN